MTRTVRTTLVWSLVLFGATATAWAHHSFAAAFDVNKPVTVQGTIVQVRLENPHSWFFIDVKNATGKVERWAFEAGTPSGMIRNGFKPGLIKQGVEVTIKGFHAKDPSQNMGMLRELVLSDGTVYGMFGSQQGPAAQ
jgi:DNA/RNA endonuclease YhcR with UshA esterase domain